MTTNFENRSITLTQNAFLSSDTRFNNTTNFPFGAYEASGYDTAGDDDDCIGQDHRL